MAIALERDLLYVLLEDGVMGSMLEVTCRDRSGMRSLLSSGSYIRSYVRERLVSLFLAALSHMLKLLARGFVRSVQYSIRICIRGHRWSLHSVV